VKSLILVAASVVGLGIGGAGVGHAALMSAPAPTLSSGQTTHWWAGYGVPATPAHMARVWKEVVHYRQLASGQQRAEIGTIRELEFPGGLPLFAAK
jgi:hypothetical protein